MVLERETTGAAGLEQPSWESVLKRNSIERLKSEKFPLDIITELPEMIARGYEAVPEEDIVLLSWYGSMHDKPKVGTFMVRIKVPGGRVLPGQLRALGEISQEYGGNSGELTTRQGVQLHWVRLNQLPEVLSAIQAAGLTTVGAEGDTVRNITGCPVSGISREELFEVQPLVQEAARFFTGNRDYSNLPRKHKYSISACPFQCDAPEVQDVALIGAVQEGRPGFTVRIGGGMSATPRIARDLGVFVPMAEAISLLRAITDTWQENTRYRLSRAKARIKFMVDDYGPAGIRHMVEERLGYRLEDGVAPAPRGEIDHLGVHRQKQDGFSYVGFPVPMGWVNGEQMRQVADIVEAVGGDIRLTRQQNFIVGNVPTDRVDWLRDRMKEAGFPLGRNRIYGTSVACTSHQFCNYSVAETKGKLNDILQELDARYGDDVVGLKVHVDGCPHGCALHWVGDIGLQGTTTKLPSGRRVPAYDISLRGGMGRLTSIGRPLVRRVPGAETTRAVIRLVAAWLAERETAASREEYPFQAFCDAHTDEDLREIATGGAAIDEHQAQGVLIRVPGPLFSYTDGADELDVEATSVREAIDVAGREHPRLKGYLLDNWEGVNAYVNLYVNDEDIRSLQGLETRVQPGDEIIILPAMAGG